MGVHALAPPSRFDWEAVVDKYVEPITAAEPDGISPIRARTVAE